jgi:hypothetical protein
MNMIELQIVSKDKVEQIPCKGLLLDKCIIVKEATAKGLPTIIMRFHHCKEIFEYETTLALFKMVSEVPII